MTLNDIAAEYYSKKTDQDLAFKTLLEECHARGEVIKQKDKEIADLKAGKANA